MEKPRIPSSWSDLASGDWLGAANPMNAVTPIPQFLIEQILNGARARLVGRDLTLRASENTGLQLVLDDLQFTIAPLAIAVGQLGTITAKTHNVRWDGGRLNELEMTFANVHLRPGLQPQLIIAPLRFRVTIRQDVLDELLVDNIDKVTVELGASGIAYARRPGKEQWGHAHVTPRIEGTQIRLVATGVTLRNRSFNAPRSGIPSVLLQIPALPGGMRMTNIELGDECVYIDAVIEEWSEPLTVQQLMMLSELVRTGADNIDLSRTNAATTTKDAS